MAHWAVGAAKFAEALIIKGAVLLSPVAGWCLVSIDALLAFETVALLLKIAADWYFVLFVYMQVLTVLASFTLSFEPVDANYFLVL